MGRWGSKTEAEDCKKVSIFWLKKYGNLCGFSSGSIVWTRTTGEKSSVGFEVSTHSPESYIRFHYTQTDLGGEKKDFDYKIWLTTTPCYFGGIRYWFICCLLRSGEYCGRRVGVLYKGGDYFGCRHCYDLTYQLRNESRKYRGYSFSVLTLGDKIDDLEASVRRRNYRGKPTRKQRMINKLHRRLMWYAQWLLV